MARRGRIFLGLNSGTSADGVDAAAIEVTGRGEGMKVRFLGHVARPYPADLRGRVLAAMAPAVTRTEAICLLDVEIGRAFAETAAALVKQLGLKQIDAIGSHGQTVCHLPPGRAGAESLRRRTPSRGAKRSFATPLSGTLQLGDVATIAARLKTPVVSHFRQADMAVGGQGAPLVPWTDWVLLRHPKRTRIIQNIGGIANLTYLPAGGGPEEVIAFDTGPGNMLIDALAAHFSDGKETCDRDGQSAARGFVELNRLMLKKKRAWDTIDDYLHKHPHFSRQPPKSCGREEFGIGFMHVLLKRFRRYRLSADTWMAQATLLTAETIATACLETEMLAAKRFGLDSVDLVLCGGGALNPTLIRMLGICVGYYCDDLQPRTFHTTADYGIPIDAKEAVSFAVLAAARVDRVPANLPRVTGAKRRVVLGDLCEPT